MVNYIFDNTGEYNNALQYLTIFLLAVIVAMLYYINRSSHNMSRDLNNMELDCPACPKCPDLECNEGKCPDCICPTLDKQPLNNDPTITKNNCPECPKVNCPSVQDIVSGIFPGRNVGITQSGEYFNVQANDDYTLMPDFDYYKSSDAFPKDSILTAPDNLEEYNPKKNNIDNSYDNEYLNTNRMLSLNKQHDLLTRMSMMGNGEETGANSLSNSDDTLYTPGNDARTLQRGNRVDPEETNVERADYNARLYYEDRQDSEQDETIDDVARDAVNEQVTRDEMETNRRRNMDMGN